MKFTAAAFCSLFVAAATLSSSVDAFAVAPGRGKIGGAVAHRSSAKPAVVLQQSATPKDSGSDFEASNLPGLDISIINDITDSLAKFDLSKSKTLQDNVMDGEFGARGELYFVGQLFLIFCVVVGGIPVIQPFLSVVLGPGLLLFGLLVALAGLSDMGASLTPFTKPPNTAQAKLVTEGLFQYMRHPIYAGLIAFMTGLSILTDSADRLLLTGVLFVFLDYKSSKEESEMLTLYGDEYETYMKQVPTKFFPQNVVKQD